MPPRLERRQQTGNMHFITITCHDRLPLLLPPAAKRTFLEALERTRKKHHLALYGYVVMPEHVHLLTDEPPSRPLATVLHVLKQMTSRRLRSPDRPSLWLPRYLDLEIDTEAKYLQKLRYLHRNPVARGLAPTPAAYPWSSFRHYAYQETGPVEIESESTALRRI